AVARRPVRRRAQLPTAVHGAHQHLSGTCRGYDIPEFRFPNRSHVRSKTCCDRARSQARSMVHARLQLGGGSSIPRRSLRARGDVWHSRAQPARDRSDLRFTRGPRLTAAVRFAGTLRVRVAFRLFVSWCLTMQGMAMGSPWTPAEFAATLLMWTLMM